MGDSGRSSGSMSIAIGCERSLLTKYSVPRKGAMSKPPSLWVSRKDKVHRYMEDLGKVDPCTVSDIYT